MPRIRRAAALLIVGMCAVTSSASAQFGRDRGGQRAQFPQNGGDFGPIQSPPTVTAVALEHAKDLALTDSQRTTIEALRTSQDSANTPLRAKLDSLRPTRVSAGGPNDLSQEQREEMETRQRSVQQVMSVYKENNDASRQKLVAVLNNDQRNHLREYEEDAQKKFEEDARRRSRSGSGGGEGRGAGGGRGRPPEG